MKRIALAASLALIAGVLWHGPAQAQNPPLLHRLIALSDDVHSYTASVHADIAMRTFPYLTPQLDGIYYHKEPSKDKIVFTGGLPLIAAAFSNVYPHVESPARWEEVYSISTEANDGRTTTLKLVPRRTSRVNHIDAKIDDRSAELVQLRWNYNDDGGYAILDQAYGRIEGHDLVTRQSGHLEIPHYTADLTSTFKDFKITAPIPDSVFSE